MSRLLGREDPAQLALDLAAAPRSAEELLERLRTLGLRRITTLQLTRNRTVMVSFRGELLRVHEGYLAAPLPVLRAVVVFVEGRTRAERRAAQEVILTHRVERPAARPRRPAPRREDAPLLERLAAAHAELNARHFGAALSAVPIRISRRMRSRLGHYSAATPAGDPAEIAISRSHVRRHGWDEVLHTLLHEMVHQWQDESGLPIDHGRAFRRKAREVGIAPAAKRPLDARRGEGAAPARLPRTGGIAAAREA